MLLEQKIKFFGELLNNKKRPLKERFRALFALKNLGGALAIAEICRGFDDDSVLLKHELAYCLGQMKDENALDILITVLKDTCQDAMVRHEAGEALGAIGVEKVIPILEEYKNDPIIEVAETCRIALDRVCWIQNNGSELLDENNPYATVDPSPSINDKVSLNDLKSILLDTKKSLFERYRCMFSLRNLGNEASILALCEGLEDPSALFRHEIAFVLGQLKNPCAISHLKKNLENKSESGMVRHECAEALGAIGTEECMKILNAYIGDDERVVRESCEVALDICEYENSMDFHYSDKLLK